jgi:hypothetical protein
MNYMWGDFGYVLRLSVCVIAVFGRVYWGKTQVNFWFELCSI